MLKNMAPMHAHMNDPGKMEVLTPNDATCSIIVSEPKSSAAACRVSRAFYKRVAELEAEALAIIHSDKELDRYFTRLTSVRGIGATSALHILGELMILPSDMSARQWVAHAGLDPRAFDSGTSIHKPARISRRGNSHLRAALYMPALVAAHHEPHIKAFYEKLLAKGKKKMQALVAIMRKLLHAIHGMLRTDTDFLGEKFFALGA